MSAVWLALQRAIAEIFDESEAWKLGWILDFGDFPHLRLRDRNGELIREWKVHKDDVLDDLAAFIRLFRDGLESELRYRAPRGPAGKWRKFSTPRAS